MARDAGGTRAGGAGLAGRGAPARLAGLERRGASPDRLTSVRAGATVTRPDIRPGYRSGGGMYAEDLLRHGPAWIRDLLAEVPQRRSLLRRGRPDLRRRH